MTLADTAASPPSAVMTSEATSRSVLVRLAITPLDAAIVVTAAALIVAFAPSLMFAAWTPRIAIVVGWLPLGLVMLAIAARRGDRASAILLAVLGVAAVSALMSGAAWNSLVGVAGRDLSVVMLAGCAGLWAAARSTSDRGRGVLVVVVTWSAVASAAIGVLQIVLDLSSGSLALQSGRPTGLAVNPVYYGAVSAGALVAVTARGLDRSRSATAVALVVLGAATTLSGARSAFGAAAVMLIVLVVTRRNRATGLAASGAMIGLASGAILDRSLGAGRNAVSRLVSDVDGGRSTVWGYALEAWTERPLLGYGIGRFRPAVQSQFSESFVREAAVDDLRQAWFDPHNAVLVFLVGTGIIGVALVAWWLVETGRRASGPLAWASLTIAITSLLQPVALANLPIALLMLGAAGPRTIPAARRPAAWRAWPAALGVVLGVVLAVGLVAADALLDRAADRLDPDAAEAAAALFGPDPTVADVVAQVHALAGDREEALEWRQRTVDREPDRPYYWTQLAAAAIGLDRLYLAEHAVRRADELQPHNVRTARTEIALALALGDIDRVAAGLDAMCDLGGQAECDLDAVRLMADYKAANR